jgi:hypothetical protein
MKLLCPARANSITTASTNTRHASQRSAEKVIPIISWLTRGVKSPHDRAEVGADTTAGRNTKDHGTSIGLPAMRPCADTSGIETMATKLQATERAEREKHIREVIICRVPIRRCSNQKASNGAGRRGEACSRSVNLQVLQSSRQ